MREGAWVDERAKRKALPVSGSRAVKRPSWVEDAVAIVTRVAVRGK